MNVPRSDTRALKAPETATEQYRVAELAVAHMRRFRNMGTVAGAIRTGAPILLCISNCSINHILARLRWETRTGIFLKKNRAENLVSKIKITNFVV